MNTTQKSAELAGRILLALLFLGAGLNKISGYAGTQAYMESVGVPGILLPLVIALEVLGAVAIMIGLHTRLVAALLALFSIASAALFHWVPGDQIQTIMFMKNLAIAGGFLVLVANGAGAWSIDARRARLSAPGRLVAGP
jgi:putative oxidoreductase